MKLYVRGLLALAALVAVQPSVQADDTCSPADCPLRGWMEKNVGDPMDKKDLKAVAAALEKVAKIAPDPKWNEGDTGWSKLAQDGVAAAKAGNFDEAQKTCKGCHKSWRNEYKAKFRKNPAPN